jgi:nucleotide-binding universal stress UspA family protein
MTYAAIVAHVQATPQSEAVLRCARELAVRFDAELVGVGAQGVPPIPDSDPTGVAANVWATQYRDSIEDMLKEAGRVFRLAGEGLSKPPIWTSGVESPAVAVLRALISADLAVIGSTAGRRSDPFGLVQPGELVVAAGRPILVVPGDAKPLAATRIVIAWKNTREARRATTDALPFLKRAENVLVLEVRDPRKDSETKSRTGEVVVGLARHGVRANAMVVDHEPAGAAEILRQAEIFGADLIVSGAYGHSRLGEAVFGGVTRDLLEQADRYLLLSH